MAEFTLNGKPVSVDVEGDTPLLWVIRENLKMTGSKFGCGKGVCGACTLLVDGEAMRSCVLPVQFVEGKSITTIEGLGGDHPVQKAWVEHNVAQCGYCQSGQIMSAVALLDKNPSPTAQQIKNAMAGNICRCGTYPKILKAMKTVTLAYDAMAVTTRPLDSGRAQS
ncbi:MAG: (2Fe-2S)-binding protein [Pseudomonadales bacterium]|nr:(2Fe-2S)-binding protein [Pseudomonadales bacterium]